jgi:hypothetical protein
MLPEVTHWMALVPLAFLAWRHVTVTRSDAAYWWLALAFSVSWLADTAAHWVSPDLVGNLYPQLQAALIAAVFLQRREAWFVTVSLAAVSLVIVALDGAAGFDVLLRSVAFATVCGVVLDRWALGPLRTALLVYFGAGLIAWYAYAAWPSWATWGVYQSMRALGLVLFCLAARDPRPKLVIR